MASFVTIAAPGRAQTAGTSTLPAGSPVVFVLDDSLPVANLRRGATFRVHLRDPLTVGGITAVAAGALDRVRVVDVTKAADGRVSVMLHLEDLPVGTIGRMPLSLRTPTIDAALPAGEVIEGKTLATLQSNREGALSMHIPSPFLLPADTPHSDFTPIPLQTATSLSRPRRSPSPSPSATVSASPQTSPSASPSSTPR